MLTLVMKNCIRHTWTIELPAGSGFSLPENQDRYVQGGVFVT